MVESSQFVPVRRVEKVEKPIGLQPSTRTSTPSLGEEKISAHAREPLRRVGGGVRRRAARALWAWQSKVLGGSHV